MEIPIETQLRQAYEYLQSGNDAAVQQANQFLAAFNEHPESIEIWLNLYDSETTVPMRRYAVVLLSTSVRKRWMLLPDHVRVGIFQRFLHALAAEGEWSIRQNLIWIIQCAMEPQFNEIVMQFVMAASQTGDDRALQIAFLLAPLIPLVSEQVGMLGVEILNRGFSSDVPETRLGAFGFLLYWTGSQYMGGVNLPGYWEKITETIPYFFENEVHDWDQLTKYLMFAFQNRFVVTPLPVLERCMQLVTVSDGDLDKLLPLCYVIETICGTYPDLVNECGAFPCIITLFMTVSSKLFDRDDSLPLTNANFFEQTFTSLCTSPPALEALWEACAQVIETIEGQFVFFCSLAATVDNFPVFYRERVGVITDALISGISSDSNLLREAAARTANIVVGFYGDESEIAQNLIRVVFDACTRYVSADLLLVLAALLDRTKDSEDLFDPALEFLVQAVLHGSPDIQAAALTTLASLAAGSTMRIAVNVGPVFQLLNEILHCPDPSAGHLKPIAMDCLAKVSKTVGELFDPYAMDVINFCMANITNEDLSFGIACFTSIELIASTRPDTVLPVADNIIGPMYTFASRNVLEEYKSDVVNLIMENGEEDVNEIETENRFMASAVALRIMSLIVKMHHDLCYRYAMIVIQCCETQNASVVNVSKSAAAFAVGNLAEALVMCLSDESTVLQSIPARMGQVIYGILKDADIKDLDENEAGTFMDGFTAAAKVVEWLDYDALGTVIKPILDIAGKLLSKVAGCPSYTVRVKDLIQSIYNFISMVVTSAEEKAPILLQDFLPLFVEFANHPDILFKSIALRFFAEIMMSASSELPVPFKESCVQISLAGIAEHRFRFGFGVLRALALRDPALAASISGPVYQVCMETLSQEVSKSENFLLTRDACISTFAAYALHVFDDTLNLDECLPVALSALPLVMDFSEIGLVTDFIKWAHERAPHLAEHIIRPLIVLFANPPAAIALFGLSEQDKLDLITILKALIEACENPDEVILACLDGDEDRKTCLQMYL